MLNGTPPHPNLRYHAMQQWPLNVMLNGTPPHLNLCYHAMQQWPLNVLSCTNMLNGTPPHLNLCYHAMQQWPLSVLSWTNMLNGTPPHPNQWHYAMQQWPLKHINEVINGRYSLIWAKREKVTEGRARKTKLGSPVAQGLDPPLVTQMVLIKLIGSVLKIPCIGCSHH